MKATGSGTIRADESYTIGEFMQRAGMGRRAFDAARRRGLQVLSAGKRRYVLGSDWLAYLRQQSPATSTT
jgi:hypothetical protein